ncbi:Protein red1 [Colletotrichum chlorophyti]|uniref:Protein red1 n=1 Tax=Colletotrichum chlorophyti TaxID=708187 RepID=A0A1Q8S4K1_9PEZI|nr:Protein red1 [Colletotrichum chlorophyti]
MNNYYPYGYPGYPGQLPTQQPYTYPPAPPFPAPPTYPQQTNNTFDARPHAQDPYENQTSTMIPGLGYAHMSQGCGWAPPQPPAASHPQQWQPREGPNLIPASQYYKPESSTSGASKVQASAISKAASRSAPKQAATRGFGDGEEGELSDGELDDVYEPQETIPDVGPSQPAVGARNATNRMNATSIANAIGARGNASVGATAAIQYPVNKNGKPEGYDAERDRSGSYSPCLSPREIHATRNPKSSQINNLQQTYEVNAQSPRSSAPGLDQHLGKDAVAEARKKAEAAVRSLWDLNVRYQDYVNEGIDQKVVKDLFREMKLDTGSPTQTNISGVPPATQSSGTPQSSTQPMGQLPHGMPPKPSEQQQQASPTAAKSAGEERKDRIARLLAAKGAKPATSNTATGPNHKELAQQQKMDALQKSRDARAQKAAERKDSVQNPTSKEASPSSVPQRPATATSNGPATSSAVAQAQSGIAQESVPPVGPASSIPGLFLSAQPAPLNSQRKRPVAADFVASSSVNKKPFGYNRQDQPFVIDVSDASEDEDVEMEIGSPTDEPGSIQRTDSPSRRTASFRDFPPLTEGRGQHQVSTPGPSSVATPQSGIISTQPKQAHLEVMDKQIEAMKRKIALAEARAKLKAAINCQSSGQKTQAQTPETVADSDCSKPSMRRVQSMGASSASDKPNGRSSPVVAEPDSSMRLPKPSDKRVEGSLSRAEKLRAVSTSLPLVESRLQAKKSKLRLLQSQMSRLEKEIEEEMAEKEKLTEEMGQLNDDSDAESGEPQNQLKSNSVDPVVTRLPTEQQSGVQSLLPAAESTASERSVADAAASASATTDIDKPLPPAVNHSHDASTSAQADNVVTGKAAFNPLEAPVSTVNAASATPEVPISQAATGDDVEESQSSTSDASDVVMGESDEGSSPGQEEEPMLDVQKPLEAVAPAGTKEHSSMSPVPADSTVSLANSDTDQIQPSSRASPVHGQISLGVNESTPEQSARIAREVPLTAQSTGETHAGDHFTPYESPLRYFRSYRYHPKFGETVPGGLRSLTYSNRIDPNLPICPDQLAGRDCPNGADCIYQHFESMKLPDDQILLQLGGTTLEGAERAQFNDGLRKLLQDMRSRNIKDFPSIAQGIIDYHNSFTGDSSKILPLGNVTI